ncbi:Alpha/Beta hydrolase protein [Scenedesmus sp. NREL 46B-D3]|nr:Alpha/Beta hydrolase protein [Scenedesmus sp. NREL 46B-D3]
MAGMISSIRFYSALLSAGLQFLLAQLYRKALGTKHPKGWPAEQEYKLLLMRQAFRFGSVQQWRSMISSMTSHKVPGLQMTCVPAPTFKRAGWRDSWWVELPPEQQPGQAKASLVLMYLHGGGFVSGDPLMYQPTFKAWLQHLADQSIHMRIFAVGYPLAPEHRFPAGLLGAVAAYDWLVEQLGGSERIVLGGDSAGGNLTIAALEFMRQRAAGIENPASTAAAAAAAGGGSDSTKKGSSRSSSSRVVPFHPPVAVLLVSPAVDLSSSSVFGLPAADAAELFRYDYVAVNEGDEDGNITQRYLPKPLDLELLRDPLVSPVYMRGFEGLLRGQLLVVAGGCEGIMPDITRFVEHAKAVSPSVQLEYHVEPDEPHCWCVVGMPHLLAKGLPVLVPFFAKAAAAAGSATAK